MSRTLLRLGVTALTTAALSTVALVPSPALAGSMSFAKSSGTMADVSWLEVGTLPPSANADGNAHFGFLTVEQASRGRGDAFGVVFDAQCPEGGPYVLPGFGHGVPHTAAKEGPCTLVGVREMKGRGLAFTIDRKFTTATLSGTLSVGEHGSAAPGTPPVAITWTGVGAISTFTDSARYSNEFGTGSFRFTSTSRAAVVAAGSRIGPMVFDDEPGEQSESRLGSYRSVSRDRSR